MMDATQFAQQQQEYRLVKRLAAHYGEEPGRVTHVGEATDNAQLDVLCVECGKRFANSEYFAEVREPSWLRPLVKPVHLGPVYRVIDNVYNRIATVLAGQCQDCGHIYYAKSWVYITKHDT